MMLSVLWLPFFLVTVSKDFHRCRADYPLTTAQVIDRDRNMRKQRSGDVQKAMIGVAETPIRNENCCKNICTAAGGQEAVSSSLCAAVEVF